MSDVSINLIKKRIESSGNITPKVAKIFAENIGTLLKEYKSEINIDQLMRQALKKENHPKPSELLSRYRVYSDKVYNEKTYERLAKDPKKYLSIVTCLAELLSLDEDYFIRTLVNKTRFSKEDLSEEDENYDFGPINRINDIIRAHSLSIIDRYNLKEFHQSNLTKGISLKWNEELRKDEKDINENLYEICDLKDSDRLFADFISKIPLIERIHKTSICKFSISNQSSIYSRFLIQGDRISLGLMYDKIQKKILPKIIIEPFLHMPGVALEKEFLEPIYIFNYTNYKKSNHSSIFKNQPITYNQSFLENIDKNIYPYSVSIRKMSSYNTYGKSINFADCIIQYSAYTLSDLDPLGSINEEKDWVKIFFTSNEQNNLNFIGLDSEIWTKILKTTFDDKIGRPGLAFCFNFPMNTKTKIASLENQDNNRLSFYIEVLSNILNESIGINRREINSFHFIDYFLRLNDLEAENMILSANRNFDIKFDERFSEKLELQSSLEEEFNINNICFSQNYFDYYIQELSYSKNKFSTYFKEFDEGVFDFMEVMEKDIKKRTEAVESITRAEKDYIEKRYQKKIAKIKSLGDDIK